MSAKQRSSEVEAKRKRQGRAKRPKVVEVPKEKKKVVQKIIRRLKKLYPNATTALRWSNPLELLVATILSAQCTDERVNQVTQTLFQKYRTAKDYADADLKDLQEEIRPTGYYRQKAKKLKELGKVLVEKYGGEVPSDMDEMLKLPGVARKTANVVLGTAFGIPSGIVVDTHMQRVSRRIGLTNQKNPEKIELELMQLVPRKHWIFFSHAMIWHGRLVCQARKPKCDECTLSDICEKRI
ncbi:MAG: hypothetical protein RUDDFDWM_000975 [Candidatus Fervidibacterota bacterium]